MQILSDEYPEEIHKLPEGKRRFFLRGIRWNSLIYPKRGNKILPSGNTPRKHLDCLKAKEDFSEEDSKEKSTNFSEEDSKEKPIKAS